MVGTKAVPRQDSEGSTQFQCSRDASCCCCLMCTRMSGKEHKSKGKRNADPEAKRADRDSDSASDGQDDSCSKLSDEPAIHVPAAKDRGHQLVISSNGGSGFRGSPTDSSSSSGTACSGQSDLQCQSQNHRSTPPESPLLSTLTPTHQRTNTAGTPSPSGSGTSTNSPGPSPNTESPGSACCPFDPRPLRRVRLDVPQVRPRSAQGRSDVSAMQMPQEPAVPEPIQPPAGGPELEDPLCCAYYLYQGNEQQQDHVPLPKDGWLSVSLLSFTLERTELSEFELMFPELSAMPLTVDEEPQNNLLMGLPFVLYHAYMRFNVAKDSLQVERDDLGIPFLRGIRLRFIVEDPEMMYPRYAVRIRVIRDPEAAADQPQN